MASLSADEKVEFLLNLLATSSDFKPNYTELAELTGINTPSNAQRRFKGIVEFGNKFALQSNKEMTKVIKEDYDGVRLPVKIPETPKKGAKRRTKDDDGDEEKQTPAKRKKVNGVSNAENSDLVKAEAKVEEGGKDVVSDEAV